MDARSLRCLLAAIVLGGWGGLSRAQTAMPELTKEVASVAIEEMLEKITVDRELYRGAVKDAKGLKAAHDNQGIITSGVWNLNLNDLKFNFHVGTARPVFFFGDFTYSAETRKWNARVNGTQHSR